MESKILEGKVAIITGASRGIGKEIAKTFLFKGASVIIASSNEVNLTNAFNELVQISDKIASFKCDLSILQDMDELIKFSVSTFGHIDILVNNAGLNSSFIPLFASKFSEFDKIMAVNCKAPSYLSSKLFNSLKESKGCIVNVSSVHGIQPGKFCSFYSMSKASLISLTKSCANEYSKYGIRCNCICPGWIETEMTAWRLDKNSDQIINTIPLQKLGSGSNIADLVVFLSSDLSSYITGSIISIDGGVTSKPIV